MSADTCCSGTESDGLIILVLILIAAIIYWWIKSWMVGKAAAVSGHTVKIGEDGPRVRLHALYSLQPPLRGQQGQPWIDGAGRSHDGGVIARGMLAQRIAGKRIKFRRLQDDKSFDREVGQVFVGCEDVGLWMVANGHAFAAKPHPEIDEKLRRRYEKAERKAKRNNLGFHAGSFDDPLEWVKPKIKEQFQKRGENLDELAQKDESLFMEVARTIAEESGEEMFVEWAAEAFLII